MEYFLPVAEAQWETGIWIAAPKYVRSPRSVQFYEGRISSRYMAIIFNLSISLLGIRDAFKAYY